ncbi:MAG: SRPBCC family protein [Gemmatimonadaceae bacterium]
MHWIIVGIAVLMALGAATAIAGYFIPQSRITARTTVMPATPQQVWSVITGVTGFPRWRPAVRGVEVLSTVDGHHASWRERVRHGVIACDTDEMTPPRRLVVRITDRLLTYAGTWTYELAPAGAGTRLTITERGEISHPMWRGLAWFVSGPAGKLERYLAALHRELSPRQPMPLKHRPLDA